MTLPKITKKQQEILKFLYRYRFLNRIQIQTLLKHKDYKTINLWLKDLRQKNYVEWIYSTHFAEKTKPAIYYLSLNGVRYLRTVADTEGYAVYPDTELHKRYKEATRQPDFIARSILIADCCIEMEAQNTNKVQRTYVLEADYIDPDHEFNFLEELRPSLCFTKRQQTTDGEITSHFMMFIADASLPRYRLKKRIKTYLEYLNDQEWDGGGPNPIALITCATLADMIYAKRLTRKLFEDAYDEEDIDILFTTTEKLKEHGITGMIWERV